MPVVALSTLAVSGAAISPQAVAAETPGASFINLGAGAVYIDTTAIANQANPDATTVAPLDALQTQFESVAPNGAGAKSVLLGSSQLLAATQIPVTTYIAVSENVVGGIATAASNDLNAMAIGPAATAAGVDALAVGARSASGNAGSTAVGSRAGVFSVNATAIGAGATVAVASDSSVAIGYGARSSSTNSMALGVSASAASSSSIAIGYNAFVDLGATNSMALGTNASVSAVGSLALGNGAVADRANTVSVGRATQQRQIINVAAGTQTTDVVNVAQLKGVATAIGGGSGVNVDGTIAHPTYNINGRTYTDVGSAFTAADGTLHDSVRYDTSSHDVVTLGGAGSTSPVRLANIAAGTQDTDAVNLNQLSGLGANIDSSGNVMNSFVAYDDTSQGAITLKGAAGTKIKGVAAGVLSAASTDAVNGAQLYVHAASTAAALGGGANVAADGTLRAPSYTIGGKTYNDVGAALAAAVTSGTSASADAVMYDSSNHDSVTLGNAGTPARVTNIAPGTLAADSSDAINGSQLYATNQNVAQNTTNIAQNTTDITNIGSRVTNIDARVTNVEGSVTNLTTQITNGEVGLVQQDADTRDLTVARDTDGQRIDFTGMSGQRELVGVAAGTTDNSAVNVGQLKPLVSALGGGAQVNADGSVTAPTYHVQGGTQTTVGDALGSLDSGLSTLQQDIATGNLGLVTQDPASRNINVGSATDGTLINMAGTAGNRIVTGVAAGKINAGSVDAVNGSQLFAHAASAAVALGGGSTVNADGSITAPSYSVGGTTVNSVGGAISNLDGRVTQNSSDITNLQTTVNTISGSVANAVQYDNSAHNSVTLGGAANAAAVKLTNLQDATLSANSTDAVTGAQLWTTNQQVSGLMQSVQNVQLNGNNAIATNTDGTPASATGDNTVAIGGGATAKSNNATAIGGGATASGGNSVAIGQGSLADQPNTVSVGSAGNERRITNIADGVAPTDAVNMHQFQSGMSDIARSAYSGTAAALALTSIPEVDANKNLAIGVGTAGYKGYQAVAVGVSARVTQALKVKIGAGVSSATTSVAAGAAYQF